MIAIVGGTGTLGRELVPMLVARRHRVRVVARHAAPAEPPPGPTDVERIAGDVREPDVLAAALHGADTVVSAMTGFGGRDALGSGAVDRHGNIGLIEAAGRAGVTRFVLLSVHEAGASHPIELFRDKWAAEEALRRSRLAWTVIRPTAYLETWLGLVGGPLVETGKTRIFGTGANPINFVSAVDVAGFVDLAVADATLGGSVIEVPGPENLTLDQLASTVEAVCGKQGKIDHLRPVMMRLARVATRLPNRVLSAQIATAIVMDSRDMTVDGPAVRAAYPSIPMTAAADVARRMFGGTRRAGANAA